MQKINFHDFMKNDFVIENKISSHIKRNKRFYKIVGVATGVSLLIIGTPNIAFAEITSIDVRARDLYYGKLLKFGKWAIILKGGWDTINKAIKEDFDGAKRSFFSYAVVFAILMGFPWVLDEVEDVFS